MLKQQACTVRPAFPASKHEGCQAAAFCLQVQIGIRKALQQPAQHRLVALLGSIAAHMGSRQNREGCKSQRCSSKRKIETCLAVWLQPGEGSEANRPSQHDLTGMATAQASEASSLKQPAVKQAMAPEILPNHRTPHPAHQSADWHLLFSTSWLPASSSSRTDCRSPLPAAK